VGVGCVRHILFKKPFVWTFFRSALGAFTALLLLFSLATSQGLIGSQLANWDAKNSWASLPPPGKNQATPAHLPNTDIEETSIRSGDIGRETDTKHPAQNAAYSKEEFDLYRQIHHFSQRYGVDPLLVRAIIRVESNFNPEAVSRRGAMGLMQIMRGTAQSLGVRDPFDVRENLEGGIRYMRMLLQRNGWNLELALASYNAGPTTVRRYKGIPPYRETRRYVWKVIRGYRNLKHANKIFRTTAMKGVFFVPATDMEGNSGRGEILKNALMIY
jgi:soluble lytic murein transglycosylase-like protein